MNIRFFQGLALILSSLISIYSFVEFFFFGGLKNPDSAFAEANYFGGLGDPNSDSMAIRGIITSVIFVVGLPAIYTAQPQIKRWGKGGLILIAIPPLLTIVFFLGLFGEPNSILQILLVIPYLLLVHIYPFPGLVYYFGYVIVGWLTISAYVFPKWVGWLLITYGTFKIAFLYIWSIMPGSPLTSSIFAITIIAEAMSLMAYGWLNIRYLINSN